MARILILIGGHLSTSPRPLKEADTLVQAGHDVTVRGFWYNPILISRDRELLANRRWTFEPIADYSSAGWQPLVGRWKDRIHRRLAFGVFKRWGWFSPALLGMEVPAMLAAAQEHRADLTIVHSEAGLWVGNRLLDQGWKVGVDFEDWFSEDLLAEDRLSRPLACLRELERRLLRECRYALAPSESMAQALAQTYHAAPPTVVYNVFPWAERSAIDGERRDRGSSRRPSLHWFSQTIGPGRGLEMLFAALPQLTTDVELHLRGECPEWNRRWLESRIPSGWREKVFVHPTVPPGELLSRLAEHDIGLALEQHEIESRDLTLTNKIFQYLQAGMALVATDTVGQREVVEKYPSLGPLVPCGDSRALAERLDSLCRDSARLAEAKSASLKAAQERYCWEKEAHRIVEAADRALARGPDALPNKPRPCRVLVTADPELCVPPVLYGGIERIVDKLVQGLKVRGHEVALVARQGSTSSADRLFPWPGQRSQAIKDILPNMRALWSAVREFKPDVIHSFSRLLYMLPLLPSELPKLMTYERKPSSRAVRRAAALGGNSLRFTGCSSRVAEQGRLSGGSWHVVYNGVDLRSYDFQAQVAADAPLIFLSRIERIKGTHTAIAAARQAGLRLLIAGNHGDEGEERRYWENEIVPHLGRDGIEYVGEVNDEQKNRLLGQAAALVVPIEWDEPFGIVFAEALACGTPVISCPRGALPEIVRHGIDGFLVHTVEEAVQAIRALPTIDRSACRRQAERLFSTDGMVEAYLKIYDDMIHRPRLTSLPAGLRWFQGWDFPHKLGICERIFGRRLAQNGIGWTSTGAGIPWKLDLENPTHRWIVYGKYEGSPFLNWARTFLPPDGIVVDSGANIGQMLLYLAQWVPQGRVFAFEPGRAAADWLEECLAQHPLLPVELLRLGLGDGLHQRHLASVGPGHLHGSWNQISETEGESVSVVPLSHVLSERSIHEVDLWKLDVEGYEVPALRGAESLLRQKRIRALYIELAGENGRQIRDYLAGFGYRGYLFGADGTLSKLSQLPEHSNGLFLPS